MEIIESRDGYKRMQIFMADGNYFVSPYYKLGDDQFIKGEKTMSAVGQEAYEYLINEYKLDETQITGWREALYTNENIFYVSEHALQRLGERNNWGRKTAMRMLQKVFEKGERAINRKDYVATWAKLKEKEAGNCVRIYTYGQDAYYVSKENVIITVHPVPNKAAGKLFFERQGREHDCVELKQKKKLKRRVPRERMPIALYATA